MAYQLGDNRRIRGRFVDANKTPYDPPVVRFKYAVNGVTIDTYVYGTDSELVKATTGDYYVDIVIPLVASNAGKWKFRFEGLTLASVPQAVREYEFVVQDSLFY